MHTVVQAMMGDCKRCGHDEKYHDLTCNYCSTCEKAASTCPHFLGGGCGCTALVEDA